MEETKIKVNDQIFEDDNKETEASAMKQEEIGILNIKGSGVEQLTNEQKPDTPQTVEAAPEDKKGDKKSENAEEADMKKESSEQYTEIENSISQKEKTSENNKPVNKPLSEEKSGESVEKPPVLEKEESVPHIEDEYPSDYSSNH